MSYFASAVCLIILFDECMLILLVMLQGPHQIINSHAVGSVSQDLALFRPVRGDNVDGPVLIPPDIRFLFYIAVCCHPARSKDNGKRIRQYFLLHFCRCAHAIKHNNHFYIVMGSVILKKVDQLFPAGFQIISAKYIRHPEYHIISINQIEISHDLIPLFYRLIQQ